MPRIDAPTVAEHHRRRRADLLAAGAALLADGGIEAVTLAGVGAATGLARSSVYQYFDSSPALLAAVVEDVFPRSIERLVAATERAVTPTGKVDAYVVRALDLATDATHRSLSSLAGAGLPPECRARIAELHEQQLEPLRAAVEEAGVADPDLTTRLVLGVIQAASQAVVAGTPKARVRRETLAFVHAGLAGTA